MIEPFAFPQGLHHFLVEACAGRVQDGADPLPPILVTNSFDMILGPSKVNLVFPRVGLSILAGLLANFHPDHFDILQGIHDTDANCADPTAQVQHHIGLLHRLYDLAVKDLAHMQVNLQESTRRDSVLMGEDYLLVIRTPIKNLWSLCGHTVRLPQV